MMPGLRRILVTALLGAFVGLGFIAALLGRHPRRRRGEDKVVPIPVAGPSRRGRGLVVAFAGLMFLTGVAGIIYVGRRTLFEPTADGVGQPLTALSPSGAGRIDDLTAPDRDPVTRGRQAPELGDRGGPPHPAPPASSGPSFDIVRVEPSGDAVIAGRAAPNAVVELLIDGRPVAKETAGADGQFTITPPTLPAGTSEIDLRATDGGGHARHSTTRIAVAVAPSRDTKPLVALTSPDGPTPVLSQPEASTARRPSPAIEAQTKAAADGGDTASRRIAPVPNSGDAPPESGSTGSTTDIASAANDGAAKAPKIVSIDAEAGGKLFVTAKASAGASVRLYLNDTLIAPATVGRDGTVTFTIGRGVRPGAYRIRLDRVDAMTARVRDRAEVPFTVPERGQPDTADIATRPPDLPRDAVGTGAAGQPAPEASVTRRESSGDPIRPSPPSSRSISAANGPPGPGSESSAVSVPEIETVRIVRGDSLWRISRRSYGGGERYTLIYDANQDQIRDPDLIYPGQILVLPSPDVLGTSLDVKPD